MIEFGPASALLSIRNNASGSGGGAYLGGAGTRLDGVGMVIEGNVGVMLLVDGIARIEHTFIDGNDAHGGDLVRLLDGSNLAFVGSTVAGNLTAPTLICTFSEGGANTLFMRAGILWQPGTIALDTLQSLCMNTHDPISIAGADQPPGFVDAAAGDYRLSSNSPNVGACADPFPTPGVDLLGIPRPTDLGERPGDGDVDRCAYQLPDRLFASEMGEIPAFAAMQVADH